jgi:hypothetical protein
MSASVGDPGCLSRIRIFFIPDPESEFFPSRIPESKRHQIRDPGSGSATLKQTLEKPDKYTQNKMKTQDNHILITNLLVRVKLRYYRTPRYPRHRRHQARDCPVLRVRQLTRLNRNNGINAKKIYRIGYSPKAQKSVCIKQCGGSGIFIPDPRS